MAKKMYCENCKWYQAADSVEMNGDIPEQCRVCTGTFDSYSSRKINRWKSYNPAVENFNNDCPRYRRKWWRFWLIKQERQDAA